MEPRTLELLSPAKNKETGKIAILAGADAVYIGAPAFGARYSASNSVADIKELVDFAHKFRAKVYVTLNTILFDDELEEARKLVYELYNAGVDALIVQDMAYLMLDLPPIALHASTQCDIRTPEKAAMLARAGFSQLVLPREFTLSQIKEAREAAGIPVEVFVHGALCVSYSGDCQAGCAAMNRSANRGVCPQMCRLPYELVDKNGKSVAPIRHYLSLRDMNQSENLADLIDAGANSFKIEGRLKDERYVANVTAEYSRRLNEIIASSRGKLKRASVGQSNCSFVPDLKNTFNRGYTTYFLLDRKQKIAAIDSPKWIGNVIGSVKSVLGGKPFCIEASLTTQLSNGDGLGYFDKNGTYCGFRLNKVEGSRLYPATAPEGLEPGMKLYRNFDKKFADTLDGEFCGCSRTIYYDVTIGKKSDCCIAVRAEDERGVCAEIMLDGCFEIAKTPQKERHRAVFSKTGGTIYRLRNLADESDDRFIPASQLTEVRRQLIQLLDRAAAELYQLECRRETSLANNEFEGRTLTYHDNVTNRLAAEFYQSRGAVIAQPAMEVARPAGELCVMTTKYCLRRELGACLKEKGASTLPSPLFLRNNTGRYRLEFDCGRCGMNVIKCAD